MTEPKSFRPYTICLFRPATEEAQNTYNLHAICMQIKQVKQMQN